MFFRNARALIGTMAALFAGASVFPAGALSQPDIMMGLDNSIPTLRKPKRKKGRASTSRRIRPYYRSMLYPHSSKRQQARYARQIAAGQLHFMPVHGVPHRRAA